MNKLSVYFHSYTWSIKKHSGLQGNRYLLDMDAKPKWLYEDLKTDKRITFNKAKPLKINDFYQVHDKNYVDAIFEGNREVVGRYSWITWSRSFVRAQMYSSGIIYDAINSACRDKTIVGCLMVEGHHAKRNHGSGFCTFNHLIVALNKFISKNPVKTLIVDLDCHLGDGTLELVKGNNDIKVFDIYGLIHNGGSNLVNSGQKLVKATNKEEYFRLLGQLDEYIKQVNPELILYIAGADPYEGDRYGGISDMDIDSIKKRDETVFKLCNKYKIPTVFTLGGGYVNYPDQYGDKKENLITLHRNTLISAEKFTEYK